MTTVAESPFAEGQPVADAKPAMPGWWERLEPLIERAGDLLNPILVKEARQSMKSRQFSITYALLLVLGWIWTALFCIAMAPRIYYVPHGVLVLSGYYLVLNIPLLIVVPFAAFRSLAAEREDGTYEMLSITALGARQIVTGKLASAILQMLLYYSALAPCIVFTYLLRGIDIITIVLFLVYTFLCSLMLSMVGLMLATVTQSRHWQLLLSVLFVMGLLAFAVLWIFYTIAIMNFAPSLPYDEPDFWIGHLGALSVYVTFFALFLFLAAGQVSFASDNRSTPVRRVLCVQFCVACGWLAYLAARDAYGGGVMFYFCVVALWLWLSGTFLTSELAELSPRARRELPQSLLGRMAFTWFNPGSGTGYVFACTNLAVFGELLLVSAAWADLAGLSQLHADKLTPFVVGVIAYGALYLGVGRLMCLLMRPTLPDDFLSRLLIRVLLVVLSCFLPVLFVFYRRQRPELVVGVLLQIVMPLIGIILPLLLLQFLVTMEYADFEYSPLQATNWVWTLAELFEPRTATSSNVYLVLEVIAVAATVVFLLNLFFMTEEIEQTRQAAPKRVQEDEQQLHPDLAAAPRNPWSE